MNAITKILVIEDNAPVAAMMVCLLTRAKCETTVAPTAEKGLELAEAGNFDLIVLDVDLPGENGFEICRKLKGNDRLYQTPVVFVSGRPCVEDVRHGLALGAVDYITKPFGVADFVFRIISHAMVKTHPALVSTLKEAAA